MPVTELIARETLDQLGQYISELEDGSASVLDPLDEKSLPIVFLKNVFTQFFEKAAGVKLAKFSTQAVEESRRFRRRLDEDDWVKRQMFAQFEEFCEILPELVYSIDDTDLLDFHDDFMPATLQALASWLEDAESDEQAIDLVHGLQQRYETASANSER